jgi:hypothetical protein
MNAFADATKVEKRAMGDLIPFLEAAATVDKFILTQGGRASQYIQKVMGDILINCSAGKLWTIEIKAEEENRHGNFFLETWSNRSRFTPGWMFTSHADWLFYYFLEEKELFTMDFSKLKMWAFLTLGQNGNAGCLWDYPEKKQNKRTQLNDTWGRCVPISILKQNLDIRIYNLKELSR